MAISSIALLSVQAMLNKSHIGIASASPLMKHWLYLNSKYYTLVIGGTLTTGKNRSMYDIIYRPRETYLSESGESVHTYLVGFSC